VPHPIVTVIICTRNRVRYLPGSVGSLQSQTVPTNLFDIIVVDNASTDGTFEWAKNAEKKYDNLRTIYEPKLGLSNARNAGCANAQSEILAYLDDDAIASPNWIGHILAAFESHNEKLAVVGGRVLPLWETTKPDWLHESLWPLLSVLDLGNEQRLLSEKDYFVGANMAIRKSSLIEAGGFRTDLGRKGSNLLSNEEIHLKAILENLGYFTIYDPKPQVLHSIPPDRLTKKWFRRRMYWQGVSDSLMNDSIVEQSKYPFKKRMRKSVGRSYRTLRLAMTGIINSWEWCRHEQFGNELYFWLCVGRLIGEWKAASLYK
jgi:glycosyltransferase involved in cell wall biosynthesis